MKFIFLKSGFFFYLFLNIKKVKDSYASRSRETRMKGKVIKSTGFLNVPRVKINKLVGRFIPSSDFFFKFFFEFFFRGTFKFKDQSSQHFYLIHVFWKFLEMCIFTFFCLIGWVFKWFLLWGRRSFWPIVWLNFY